MCNLVPHERNFTQTPLSHFPAPHTVTANPAVRRPRGEKDEYKGLTVSAVGAGSSVHYGIGWHWFSLLFPVCCIKKGWHLPVSLKDYWPIRMVNSCTQLHSRSTSSKGNPEFSSSVSRCCLSSDTRLMKVEEKRRQRLAGREKRSCEMKELTCFPQGGFPSADV